MEWLKVSWYGSRGVSSCLSVDLFQASLPVSSAINEYYSTEAEEIKGIWMEY